MLRNRKNGQFTANWKQNLLTWNNDKTVKGEKAGYRTFVLYMAPHNVATKKSLCPYSTPGCREGCLNTAGRGTYDNVQNARAKKAQFFENNQETFMSHLVANIEKAIRNAKNAGLIPVFRLNGTTDIMWENIPCTRNGRRYKNIMNAFCNFQFYDYTKIPYRYRSQLPRNYDLTFSIAETADNQAEAREWLANGGRCSVVAAYEPETFFGAKVVDGDEDDLTFLKPRGILKLKPKGKARYDKTGFVFHSEPQQFVQLKVA